MTSHNFIRLATCAHFLTVGYFQFSSSVLFINDKTSIMTKKSSSSAVEFMLFEGVTLESVQSNDVRAPFNGFFWMCKKQKFPASHATVAVSVVLYISLECTGGPENS